MKTFIFACFSILCLAGTAAAQQQQQVDTTPPPSQWIRANDPSHSGVGVDYLSPDTSWGGGSDVGRMISTDGGLNWSIIQRYIPYGGMVMRNAHEGYLFPSQKTRIYKTMDAWHTWDSVPCPMLVSSAVIVDSLHAFTADGDEVGRTTDAGKTWIVYPGAIGGSIGFANPAVGYIVGGKNYGPLPSEYGAVCFKTVDSGNTWYQIYTGIPEDAGGIAVIDPFRAVVIATEGIYRTTDSGAHWQKIPWNDPTPGQSTFNGISINKNGIGYIAGTGYSNGSYLGIILRTSDTGNSWKNEPSGVNAFLYDPVMYDDSLAACADDSGIILIRRNGSAGVQEPLKDSLFLNVFPNPGQDLITLTYTLPEVQHVTMLLYDAAGHLLSTILNGALQSAGAESIPISTVDLSNGNYFYQFSSENYTSSGSFTIQR